MSISTSWTAQFLLLLHTFLKCPVLLHAAHVFPYAGHCLGGWLCLQYLHGCLWCVAICISLPWVLFGSVPFFILSNALISVRSFNTIACALCASTLLAHASTSSLVICTLLVLDVNSLIILSNMILSFNPWINCSFSCLFTSLCPPSAAAICNHPIHSSALSFSLLHSFLNCSNFIFSLNCGQNLVASVSNNPWRMLHACFSASVMLSM